MREASVHCTKVGEQNLMLYEAASVNSVYIIAGQRCKLCAFFFPLKKGKPQKETEMKRKQVNKCGFTETEGQFILSTASKNLENIWKSQKTS